jgi:hypothetical protein
MYGLKPVPFENESLSLACAEDKSSAYLRKSFFLAAREAPLMMRGLMYGLRPVPFRLIRDPSTG